MTKRNSFFFAGSLAWAVLSTVSAFQLPVDLKTVISSKSSTSVEVSASMMPESVYLTTATGPTRTKAGSNVQLKTYNHDGWTLKYRYKPAAKCKENEPPLLLVHPVGIGMSSWFWDEFLDNWQGGAVYAPDLIGCGIDNGSDGWVPKERGLFFPLSWVKGCETMIQKNILPSTNPISSLLGKQKVTVVTQGGLAPVGVMLAARNPDTVSNLVMTSPPTWKDMTTAVPEKELAKNYNFLRSPLGGVAFGTLESEWAIRFFSNLFLFNKKADDKWMDMCLRECAHQEARPPIEAFNAGLIQHRSYLEELTSLSQPVTIVQGKGDTNRIPLRADYETEMQDCTLVTLPEGLNVLPWECPGLFAETLQREMNR